jgi:hypothetical protein
MLSQGKQRQKLLIHMQITNHPIWGCKLGKMHPKAEGQTIQWSKEGQTIQWSKKKDRQYNDQRKKSKF